MENNDLLTRISKFEKDLEKLTKKHNLTFIHSIVFPNYPQLPEELKNALIVVEKYNPKFKLSYSNVELSNNKKGAKNDY